MGRHAVLYLRLSLQSFQSIEGDTCEQLAEELLFDFSACAVSVLIALSIEQEQAIRSLQQSYSLPVFTLDAKME